MKTQETSTPPTTAELMTRRYAVRTNRDNVDHFDVYDKLTTESVEVVRPELPGEPKSATMKRALERADELNAPVIPAAA